MRKKEKNREVNVPIPRVYFFFAGAFFSSFFGSGFLATNITSGFYICQYLYLKFGVYLAFVGCKLEFWPQILN